MEIIGDNTLITSLRGTYKTVQCRGEQRKHWLELQFVDENNSPASRWFFSAPHRPEPGWNAKRSTTTPAAAAAAASAPVTCTKLNFSSFLLAAMAMLSLSGCASRPDYTLNPPAGTEWLTVAVKLPPDTEVLPLDVLYRSETCRRKVYDQSTESHVSKERGLNPMQMELSPADGNGFRQIRIALDGGTKCGWALSGVRVGIRLAKTSALAKGKDTTPANYVFDFDDEGYSSAFGHGKPNPVRGDLIFKTEFFPMEYIYRSISDIDIDLFAGNTKEGKWNRYYRISGTKKIRVEPTLYSKKVVRLESPKSRNDSPGMTVLYPDGSTEKIRGIAPDYTKLLLMK